MFVIKVMGLKRTIQKSALMVLLLLASQGAWAQMDVQFSDYVRLKSYYNPAVSGTDGLLNVVGAYAMQFVGYDDAPKTMYVSADIPIFFLSPRHGAGVSLMSDDVGIFRQQTISLQYAFNMKLGKKSRLAIGVNGGLIQETIDASGITLPETGKDVAADPAFPSSEVKGSHVDLSAGIYFYHPKYWGGISVRHLAAPLIEVGETTLYQIDRTYYLMGGGNIRLKNSLFSLHPSFMVMSDMKNWREDIQLKVSYEFEERSFYAGVGYSPDISTTFFLGGKFHGIGLGYSYQMFTTGVGMLNGSHEITLGYQTELDLFKKGRNRHKSVRFL